MENTFQKKFKGAVTFPDKKEVVRREKVDLLAFIKQYTRDNIYDKLSVKELSKIKELMKECPEKNRKYFLKYGINPLIDNNKDLEIEGKKIIELMGLCPEEYKYHFLLFGINFLINNNKDLEIEGKKIIELMGLCPEEYKYHFLLFGINPLIDNNKDLEIEGKKIIELINLCPKGDGHWFLVFVIKPLIDNNKDLEIEGKKIIELMGLCPEDNMKYLLQHGINTLIEKNKKIRDDQWEIFGKYAPRLSNTRQISSAISETFTYFFQNFSDTNQYEKYIKYYTKSKSRFLIMSETIDYLESNHNKKYNELFKKSIDMNLSPEKSFKLILIFNNFLKNEKIFLRTNTKVKKILDTYIEYSNESKVVLQSQKEERRKLKNNYQDFINKKLNRGRIKQNQANDLIKYIQTLSDKEGEYDIIFKIIKNTDILDIILQLQNNELTSIFYRETGIKIDLNSKIFENKNIDDINDTIRIIIKMKGKYHSQYQILLPHLKELFQNKNRKDFDFNKKWLNEVFKNKKQRDIYTSSFTREITLTDNKDNNIEKNLQHFINESERILKILEINLSDEYINKNTEDKVKEIQTIYQKRIKENKNHNYDKDQISDLRTQISGMTTTLSNTSSKLPKELKLEFSENPIDTLMMGKMIGSCLNPDDINFWSCFANTIDINKKVLFIKDKKNGDIWARVLIGINEHNKLIRYRIYKRYNFAEDIDKEINQYLRDFAKGCGLELDNSGKPKELSGLTYYDDGVKGFE